MMLAENRDNEFQKALAELSRLRLFAGAPAEFWPAYIAAVGNVLGADRGLLILRDPGQPDRLKKVADWSRGGHPDAAAQAFNRSVGTAVQSAIESGSALIPLDTGSRSVSAFLVAIVIPLPGVTVEKSIAAYLVSDISEAQAIEALARLRLAADVPVSYRQAQESQQARADVEKFASVLDVMVLVNAEKRFLAATLAFCNGLATRFGCDRVSIGWIKHGYVRLNSMSRTERFDRNMSAVKALEVVMEESFDQNDEIVFPPPPSSNLVTRDHEIYAREQGVSHLCSLPLRVNDAAVGVLTCERNNKAFSPLELQQLRLTCDQATPRLADLHKVDRWFGSRWAAEAREKFATVLGPEHTWTKVSAIACFVGLIVLCLPIFPYRVEGNFILRSDEVAFLSAPFDGYVSQVAVRPGDVASSNATLLKLDTADLELEEGSSLAELNRFSRESEKARADAERVRGQGRITGLAEMRINDALLEQSQKRLEIIRRRLQQAQVKAPFNSIVIEGDFRQRIGAPVKLGEPLFRIAKLDTLYVEAEVNERDVREIVGKTTGEVAFVAQPKRKFPINVTRIEPAAVPREGQNIFIVRCALQAAPEGWWRPGMSGVCKINVEKRTLLWILTHRTVDFLRMLLWW